MANRNKAEVGRINGLGLVMTLLLAAGQSAASELFTDAKGPSPFAQPVPLQGEEADLFALGRSFFSIPWVEAPSATTARDGLGPHFNANTCASCHVDNGSGQTINSNSQPLRALIFKLSQPAQHAQRWTINNLETPLQGSVPDPVYGAQIAINGNGKVQPEAHAKLKVEYTTYTYPDGQSVTLTSFQPYLENPGYGPLATQTLIALRQPPPLAGLGLLEQVSDEEILRWADPDDRNQDGISGKANWLNKSGATKRILGRFNWKASEASILSQTASAAALDMGLTNPAYPEELCQPLQHDCSAAPKGRPTALGSLDLPASRLQAIAFYVAAHKAPQTRSFDTAGKQGFVLFRELGCAACHRETLATRDGVLIQPFSDLLLHDLGPALADGRLEFEANGEEFRTAPLWGMGARQRARQRFLHDARAATPEEAILWHGGEATAVQAAFTRLEKSQRAALLSFLEQL